LACAAIGPSAIGTLFAQHPEKNLNVFLWSEFGAEGQLRRSICTGMPILPDTPLLHACIYGNRRFMESAASR